MDDGFAMTLRCETRDDGRKSGRTTRPAPTENDPFNTPFHCKRAEKLRGTVKKQILSISIYAVKEK